MLTESQAWENVGQQFEVLATKPIISFVNHHPGICAVVGNLVYDDLIDHPTHVAMSHKVMCEVHDPTNGSCILLVPRPYDTDGYIHRAALAYLFAAECNSN